MKDMEERNPASLDLNNLKVISAVGRGAKGVVFLVKDESGESDHDDGDDDYFALKVISKALIEQKGKAVNNDGSEYKRIGFERDVLSRFDHPLLPRLRGVLDTENMVGYGMVYCPGGNLHSLRKKQTEKMFSHDVIRFYAAEIVLALEYLHNLGIIYRDLKPENIMVQENGHIMLVDFDLSTKVTPRASPPSTPSLNSVASPISFRRKKPVKETKKRNGFSAWQKFCNSGIRPEDESVVTPGHCLVMDECHSVEKSNSFVGTEEYVAPEIVSGDGHDFSVDWWSLGVLLYEMLYGTTPFKGANRKETFYRILTKEPELTGETTSLRDLIRRLLEKNPSKRIRAEEIKGHDFFKGVEWDSILKISRAPYIPENEINECRQGCEKVDDVELFVHGVFFGVKGGEEEKNKEKKNINGGEEENVCSKRMWVEELNQNPIQSYHFSIF